MSGGAFEYNQYKITDIADDIEREIERSGKPRRKEDIDDWSGPNYPEYPSEVLEKFKEAVNVLRIAAIYAHRVDYYLSGDDGEESFMKRLQEELAKVEKL